jgi:hypothetical protein
VKGKEYIDCVVSANADGSFTWSHEGVDVFCVHSDGRKEDLRKRPPYLTMNPCPYCGAHGPKVASVAGHDPLRHVDPSLGSPVT